MVQRLHAPCPAHMLHTVSSVHRGPTCTVTSDLMSATLAEAWSVASLLVLPRRPSYQSPPHLWMPLRRLFHTRLPLGTFLRNSHSGSSWLHLLRMMFSALRVLDQSPRYFLMRLCRRLYTASQLMMPPHNYHSRNSSSGASCPMTLWTAKLCHRHIALLVAPHRLNLLTLLRFVAPAAPAMLATVTSTLRLHMSYCSHHRVLRSMPVNMPHMVFLLKRHRCDLICVHPSQSRPHSHMSVPPKWEHILCAREVQVPPLREPTIQLVLILVQEQVLSLNHEPLFFLLSNFVNPSLVCSVTLMQLTAISCITHTVSLFFSGIQDRPAGTPPILLRLPVESSMRLFFKKPVIMSRTSLISSLHTLATRTSPSFSTRTPSSPTLRFSPSRKTP